jgi:ParB family chromosome partitioning protein
MRITQDLSTACFDKTECTACPFNSASQRALFETHVDDGHCTNPTCFQLKTETVENARLEEQQRTAAAQTDDHGADLDDNDDTDEATTRTGRDDLSGGVAPSIVRAAITSNPASPGGSAKTTAVTSGPSVTAKSIATCTTDLREATWRTALARGLAHNAAHARTAILVAALTGTLSQIKASTLTARAGLLINSAFPDLDFKAKIEAIRALSGPQAETVLSAIGAAYAMDVQSFGHVADLAQTCGVDLRDGWKVDRPFLERYTKDELKFIAQECGLVAHMGERAFGKLLASKKTDLVTGMLNAARFDWTGRLPSAMTLDGKYGPPSIITAPEAVLPHTETRVGELAA